MRCDQAREQIGALLDGELPAPEARTISLHAQDCADCARYRDELKSLRGMLMLERETAPASLAHRVRAALADEQALSDHARGNAAWRAKLWRTRFTTRIGQAWPALARQAAAILFVCVASVAVTWWWVRANDAHEALARDVLAAHIRSLLQDNTVQVAALDTHTVKPWFAGRLEFTPVVKDLSGEGFQLVGGRLDFVGGQRVAAIVYRRRLHQVNVFIWPGSDTKLSSVKIKGYNLVSWSRGGMTFWAASDLNEAELRELQSLL
jgi:anti-sigma factor RsiW